jgi:CDP-4-dehydro-6-deoxyglucose reductase
LPVLTCPIASLSYLNHDTRKVLLDTGENVDFQAGQYLEVVSAEKRYPFSIASAPGKQLELHIKPTPNSPDSERFEALLDNSVELTIDLPKGKCFIDSAPAQPLLMLAAATGISQMKSIIEHLLPRGLVHPTYLYWGVVSDKDLYLTSLCETWAAQDSNFHFVPVVSEPENSPNWTGKTGLVGHAALEDFSDISNLSVIVGGSPNMVYATLDLFVARGLPKSNMDSDVFDYAPRT